MVDYPKNEAKRAARDRLTGLWAATITPFTADGMLDEAALRNDLMGTWQVISWNDAGA